MSSRCPGDKGEGPAHQALPVGAQLLQQIGISAPQIG